MATLTSAFTTSVAVGNREDLSDIIYRVDPTDTPFFSGIEKSKAKATNHEWQTQALAAPTTSNYHVEGDDSPTADASTATVRLGNYLQIQRKIAAVSGTQQAVDHAGRDSEIDYQATLAGLELKRDIETTFVGANQAKVSSEPRKMASVLSWIKTNTDKGASGADPTAADGTSTRTDGTARAFTEAQLKNVIRAIFDSGGKPDTIMAGSFNKQVFSTFTGRGTPMQDQTERKITAAVDVYESDFGRMKVVANRFMRKRDVLILQMDMWARAPLSGRDFVSIPLARNGDYERRMILVEHTLEARNEKASGGVFDLTTS
jgi:hypothetical protein